MIDTSEPIGTKIDFRCPEQRTTASPRPLTGSAAADPVHGMSLPMLLLRPASMRLLA